MSGTNEQMTTSSTGAQKGVKDERFDLLPVRPLQAIARHYGIGARKYADRNWEKGYEWSKSYQALQRHLSAFWGGEDIDEETGSPHLAAAAFHVLALLEFAETHPELDDRVKRESLGGCPWPSIGWIDETHQLSPTDMPTLQSLIDDHLESIWVICGMSEDSPTKDELLTQAIDFMAQMIIDQPDADLEILEEALEDQHPEHWDIYDSADAVRVMERTHKVIRRREHEAAELERQQPGARVSVREILRALDENPVPIETGIEGVQLAMLAPEHDAIVPIGALGVNGSSIRATVAFLDALEAAGLQVTRA